MPRLAREGVVGADAIFACLGPALELFSRYARVEKVSGEAVALAEYLEHVWAAVAREALSMIFEDADATGLEPDARVTAMWLWTLTTGAGEAHAVDGGDRAEDDGEDDDAEATRTPSTGFALEFDAARKIAQGLGARLEALSAIVEVKGNTAWLLSVRERGRSLLGRTDSDQPRRGPRKKQMSLFETSVDASSGQTVADIGAPAPGTTTLDRVHQAMLLFGAGQPDALRRFLVEHDVGKESGFWRLAQSLAALYPPGCEEKRWVEGVLARKKGLGFG